MFTSNFRLLHLHLIFFKNNYIVIYAVTMT